MSTANELNAALEEATSECLPEGFSTLFPLSALAVLRLAEIEQRMYDLERVQEGEADTSEKMKEEETPAHNHGSLDKGIWQFGSPERREELRALLLAAHTGYDNSSSASSEHACPRRDKTEKEDIEARD
jgi:hypothetical protein